VNLYSAFIVGSQWRHSGMDHTFIPAKCKLHHVWCPCRHYTVAVVI